MAEPVDARKQLREDARKLGFFLALAAALMAASMLLLRSRKTPPDPRPAVVNALGGGFLPAMADAK